MRKYLRKLLGLTSFIAAFFFIVGVSVASATVFQGFQGGTGYGSATTSNVGQALIVASTSPYLTYTFGNAGGTTTITASGTTVSSPFVFTSTPSIFPYGTGTSTVGFNLLPSPTDTIQRFLSETGNGTSPGNPSWQVIPSAGYQTYYMTASSSDVSNNLQLQATPQTVLASTTVTNLASGTSSIQYFVTNAGAPNITSIPAGTFQVSFTARQTVTGASNAQIYAVINEVNSLGVFVKNIETTQLTSILTTASTSYNIYADMPQPYLMASSTSRIQVQLVASVSTGGTAPTVKVYYGDGADDSRLVFPSQAVSARTYLPYIGATQSVNLGNYGLTGTGVTSTALNVSGLSTTNGISNTGNITSTTEVITTSTISHLVLPNLLNSVLGTDGSGNVINDKSLLPTIATTTKGVFDAQPSTSTPDIIFYTDTGFTLKQVDCVNSPMAGNTFTFSLIASSSVQSTATTTVMNGFVCNSTSTIQSTTTFNNAAIPANSIIQVNYSVASTTGAYVDLKF